MESLVGICYLKALKLFAFAVIEWMNFNDRLSCFRLLLREFFCDADWYCQQRMMIDFTETTKANYTSVTEKHKWRKNFHLNTNFAPDYFLNRVNLRDKISATKDDLWSRLSLRIHLTSDCVDVRICQRSEFSTDWFTVEIKTESHETKLVHLKREHQTIQ